MPQTPLPKCKLIPLVGPLRGAVCAALALAVALAGVARAQTLSNIGATAPSPGPDDIFQLSTSGDQTWPDGLNYFTDNNPPVGQTFTTGTNALNLVSVAIKTAGLNNGNGYGTPSNTPTYYLRIYSMSGSTATLLNTFRAANPGFTDGNWLQWSGLNVPLAANNTYAFSFGIQPTGGGWAALAVATNAYAGGEIAIIPISGGVITAGSGFDAVFDLGLLATNSPAVTPWPNPTYGWNLGDTLEPPCGPGCWGPLPTQALINAAANDGFNAIRIPCAWDSNANQTNHQISSTYMAQVQEVVGWAIAAGMTVVINDHWDDGWLENNIGTTVNPTINAKMDSYWTQIATAFSGYGNSLLFAAANEPNVTSPAEMVTLMVYYQTFVNAVRGVGGNNTNRWLVLQNVADASWLNALPTDPTPNRLMVEYHNYTPFQFTELTADASWGIMFYFWGPAYHYSGDPTRNATWGEEGTIDMGFQQLTDLYVSKGIPVMIGEFQAAGKSFLTGTEATYNSASAHYWNKYVAESARAHGLSPFYWSTPGSPFDWTTGAVDDLQDVTALTGGTAPPPPNGAPYAASGLTATAGNGQVTLSWTAGSGATSYDLFRAAEAGNEGTNPVVTGITGTSYTDTGLNSGTTYYYHVAAVNSSGWAGFAPEASATTPGVNPDPAQFSFETDLQGWAAGSTPIAGVALSTAQHFAGRQSLAVNFNGTAAGTSSVSVDTSGVNLDVTAGATITFHVWIPSGNPITAFQPYLEDYDYAWTGSNYGSLTANAWNTITVTVPPTAVTPLQQLGIQFTTSAAWSGACYIDSVAWNTPSPDFSLSANPASLTVNSGSNGTSTITVTPLNGLNNCYTLSASGLPGGVTATFGTNPTIGTSVLTLTASNIATTATSNVTITGTGGTISHTTTIALTLHAKTPPTLLPIANQTVNAGHTVAFTASATDTNQPAPTLAFALLAGATNATLTQVNNTNANFSFRPLVTQANSTNSFALEVFDTNTPSLSATQSFSIIVNPLSDPGISNISFASGQFSFNVSGQSGPDYAIETSTNLMQWSDLFITNSPVPPFHWTDTNAAARQRFYRIQLGPPLP
jgi:aryl-phospho-beta-D-glucosidase BglC (GH1 family)